MKAQFIVLALIGLAVSACDRKKPSEATTTTESTSVAAARGDEDMLRAEISRGLEEQLNVIMLPVGDIEIMSGLSSQMESNDFQRKRFKADYLNLLNDLKSRGLLTYAEQRQSELDAIGRMGVRTLTVTPTDLAKQHRDEKLSSPNYLVVRIATCEVRNIVRSSPYQSPHLPQSEEYRLVLGTYSCKGIPWFLAIYPEGKDGDFKFRAVLKLNPFTKRYVFVTGDCGDLQEDGWKSSNVQ